MSESDSTEEQTLDRLRTIGRGEASALRPILKRLGEIGGRPSLAAVLALYADPTMDLVTEAESTIRQILARLSEAPEPEFDSAARRMLQAKIEALNPSSLGEWPIRVAKEELQALPLHGSANTVWALRPDGQLLAMDHVSFGHPTEPEPDPLTRFACLVHAAGRDADLVDFIPAPPPGAKVCSDCRGTGSSLEANLAGSSCLACRGLGWVCGH